jgi:quercetin dioxygenase-like cupin family protein
MAKHSQWKFTLGADGIERALMDGVRAKILCGEAVMLSHVTIGAHTETLVHSHPEEQWGVCLKGSCTRIQGAEEAAVREGDCWHTPGGVPHGIRTGDEEVIILDVFSPPRQQYRKAGSGFGD